MFVGHYSASFAGKALAPRAPLWVLLLAAQLVDVAWVVLVLAGVERVALDPTLATNPLVLEHMPWTHSLAATGVWAGAASALVARSPRLGGPGAAAAVVGATVASHWLLDVLVHRPDLTLWPGSARLGLALWDRPLLGQALELGLLFGALALAAARGAFAGGAAARAGLLAAGLTALQLGALFGPLPGSVLALLAPLGLVFLAVALAGAWVEGGSAP